MELRISWRAKLKDSKGLPRVEAIAGKMSTRWGSDGRGGARDLLLPR